MSRMKTRVTGEQRAWAGNGAEPARAGVVSSSRAAAVQSRTPRSEATAAEHEEARAGESGSQWAELTNLLSQHLVEQAKRRVEGPSLTASPNELSERSDVWLRAPVGPQLVPHLEGGFCRSHLRRMRGGEMR